MIPRLVKNSLSLNSVFYAPDSKSPFYEFQSDRERTPEKEKASEGVRGDKANDEKGDENQVPHCPLPVVRSASFIDEGKAEEKDDEENNDVRTNQFLPLLSV